MGKWKINRKKKMVRIIILITASVLVFLFFVFNALNSACVVYVLLFFYDSHDGNKIAAISSDEE